MIINFGSINADHVYQVDHMPGAGETLAAMAYDVFVGGKGLNQSVAIARSGGYLRHVGCVGPGDTWMPQQIGGMGVGGDHIHKTDAPTGHAIIYVDPTGENEIVIFGGANRCLNQEMVMQALAGLDGPDHWVLFQNETNLTGFIAETARLRGFRVAYSAAPFSAAEALPLLPMVDLLVVNETEAAELAAATGTTAEAIDVPMVLITKGKNGSDLWMGGSCTYQPAYAVEAVDTTGAGDTFLGSFLAKLDASGDATEALNYATAASALQVTRPGAANAIPGEDEVKAFMEAQAT
ncbi:MAG: ribokinase [Rhodobacteraceae bacterium]|nr:ribokinase [Paracoccaceae bacterium]